MTKNCRDLTFKGGFMEFNEIHIGMNYDSTKGSGTVTWIDGSTRTVYMADTRNNNNFQVEFDEIITDPKTHNNDNTVY